MGSERDNRSASHFSYTDTFNARFPYYLSIGMTEEQYWDKDCMLAKYYREAEEMRVEKQNQLAWLQGMYVYDAISRIAPILNPSAKKGTRAKPYVDKPYPITDRSIEESKKQREIENAKRAKTFMEAFTAQTNKRFKEGSE